MKRAPERSVGMFSLWGRFSSHIFCASCLLFFVGILLSGIIIWHFTVRTDKEPISQHPVFVESETVEPDQKTSSVFASEDEDTETKSFLNKQADFLEPSPVERPARLTMAEKAGKALPEQPEQMSVQPDTPIVHPRAAHDVFPNVIDQLLTAEDREDIQSILKEAESILLSLPPEQAASAITAFLNTQDDVELNMPFRVGINGCLRNQPTLRIAALDWLGQVASEEAAIYSKTIFETSSNPDEWAIAIRNYGRTIEPGHDPYFTQIVQEMITNQSWRQHPSGGYAEAHDALVFELRYDLVPGVISSMEEHPQYRILGEMALDNLIQADRRLGVEYISENLDILDSFPALRAKLMARADPRDEFQSGCLREYLLNEEVAKNEKQAFLQNFPAFGRFLSHRLITQDHIWPLIEQVEIDIAAADLLSAWRSDDGFAEIFELLDDAKEKSLRSIESARRAGLLSDLSQNAIRSVEK